jgi:RHS repeat-associated protein
MSIKRFNPRALLAALATVLFVYAGMAQSNSPSTTAGQVPGATGNTTPAKPAAYTAGTSINFVRTWVAQQPYTSEASLTGATSPAQAQKATLYFDGLGRPVQSVSWQASPTGKDIVQPQVYNAYGQEEYKYLPYADAASADGSFKLDPFGAQATFYGQTYKTEQPAYQGEQYYYSHVKFEASPLNRVLQIFAPGNSWAGSEGGTAEKSNKAAYLVNIADEVRLWTITSGAVTYAATAPYSPTNTNVPTSTAAYAAGTLYKNVTLDEAGNAAVEYKDLEGRVVLKKVQIGTIAADYSGYTGFLCTYYVYDDLGQLRFVIPPKAVAQMLLAGNWVLTSALVNELCFRYEYDSRLRLTQKKVPGAGWVYSVYDMRDRPVFTQDENMRQKGQWLRTIYDALNRPVETDMVTYSANFATLQTYVTNNSTALAGSSQTVNGSIAPSVQANLYINSRETGRPLYQASSSIVLDNGFASEDGALYTVQIAASDAAAFTSVVTINDFALPAGATAVPLTLTYYDNYSQTAKSYNTANNSKLNKGANAYAYADALPAAGSAMVRGMVTSIKVRVIENATDLTVGAWLETATFYDEKGRAVQVQADNYKGGKDAVTTLYSFAGKPLCNYQVHNNAAGNITGLRVKTTMVYDVMGRLLNMLKNINDDTSVIAAATTQRTIATYTYDALGQMKSKQVGQKTVSGSAPQSTPLENDSYSYNIRGWLKGINWAYPGSSVSSTAVSAASNKWFGMDLSYDWGFATKQYNGNIAGQQWANAGDGATRAYGYGYDAANRLRYADFNQNFGGTWAETDPANSSFTINYNVTMGTFTNGTPNNDAYDENGNILKMQQYGLVLNSSQLIDNLQYTYLNSGVSNKLRAVTDGGTQPAGVNLGDFNDKNTGTDDYGYDKNGNLITDLNKRMNGSTGADLTTGGAITYNYLNLPYQLAVKNDDGSAKGTITYIYDAMGNKLEKRTVEAPAASNGNTTIQTTTSYLGAFVYQNNILQYFGMEEGRIRYIKPTLANNRQQFAYDYVLKDHLGNTRVVLTDELQQEVYPAATLEGSLSNSSSAIAVENNYYSINTGNIVPATSATGITAYINKNGGANATDPPVNNNPNSSTTAASQYVYQLNGSGTAKTGLGITLKVMAGDVIDIWGKSYYFNNNTSGTNTNVAITDIISGLLGTPTGAAAGKGATVAGLNVPGGTVVPSSFLTRTPAQGDQTPNAGINYIIFDEQFRYVSSGFSRVNTATSGTQQVKDHHGDAAMQAIAVPKNGYIYVYVSNQSPVNVFFDNLQVIHTCGPLLETDNYYPFGLVQSGISSKAAGKLENKLLYNGKELQNKEFSDGSGLDEYDYGDRHYNAQIGRFMIQDPFAEKYLQVSPYQYALNNPITNIDVNGDSSLAYFYDQNGNPTNTIPQQVLSAFQQIGINLGYNVATNMLYGTAITGPTQFATTQKALLEELGSDCVSEHSFVFGYNLAVSDGASTDNVQYGENVPNPVNTSKSVSVFDLADFNSDNTLVGSYNGNLPTAALNLSRVIEHEFLGHGKSGLLDKPNSYVDPGPNENKLGNIPRSEANLPLRINYGNQDYNPSTFSFDNYIAFGRNGVEQGRFIINAATNNQTSVVKTTIMLPGQYFSK